MAVTYVATGLGAGGNSSFNSATRASAPMAIVPLLAVLMLYELARANIEPTLTAGASYFNRAETQSRAVEPEAECFLQDLNRRPFTRPRLTASLLCSMVFPSTQSCG